MQVVASSFSSELRNSFTRTGWKRDGLGRRDDFVDLKRESVSARAEFPGRMDGRPRGSSGR